MTATVVSCHDEIAGSIRAPQACKLAGITYRKLDYWDRVGLVKPSVAIAAGSGTSRRYSTSDVLHLAIIEQLITVGVSLQLLRRLLPALQERLPRDITAWKSLIVVWTAHDIRIAASAAELLEVVAQSGGPLGCLPLAELAERLNAGFVELGLITRDNADRIAPVGAVNTSAP